MKPEGMATATVQFQNVEQWVGAGATNLANAIDGDDNTYATLPSAGDGGVSSLRFWNPVIPADFGTLTTLTLRLVRQYSASPGRGDPSVARVYTREADLAAWVMRYDGGVDHLAKQTDTVVIPVTNLADLQVLVENYDTPADGGGTPDPPFTGG